MIRILIFALFSVASGCDSGNSTRTQNDGNKDLAGIFERYYKERMALLPLEATQNGDSIHNDKLPVDFTDSYREKLREFFTHYKNEVAKVSAQELNDIDKSSYDIFKREMDISLEGL